jgi:hypothetical protein
MANKQNKQTNKKQPWSGPNPKTFALIITAELSFRRTTPGLGTIMCGDRISSYACSWKPAPWIVC